MNQRTMLLLLAVALSSLACTRSEAAQLSNVQVIEKAAAGSLKQTLGQIVSASVKAAWISWDVPSVDPNAQMCCFNSIHDGEKSNWRSGACSLDGTSSNFTNRGGSDSGRPGLKRDTFSVYLRLENRAVSAVRMFSQDCRVDGAGLTVHHLTGVQPKQSVAYLTTLLDTMNSTPGVKHKGDEDRPEHVIGAIAMHRTPGAMQALEGIVGSNRNDEIRGHAAFWLGMKGGDEGRAVLTALLNATNSEHLKEQAVTGIALDETKAATDLLLSLAKTHSEPGVRKHAIFWLGQKAGERATADLARATGDPNEDVQEMAVFSISQLPNERAIPELIQLAKTHKSKTVRERAVFWLGQSGDPRALAYIEEILTK